MGHVAIDDAVQKVLRPDQINLLLHGFAGLILAFLKKLMRMHKWRPLTEK